MADNILEFKRPQDVGAEEEYAYVWQCGCGSITFVYSPELGLICTDCDTEQEGY